MFPSPESASHIFQINSDPLLDIPINHMKGEVLHNVYPAQVDAATETTVAPYLQLLHIYCKYMDSV